ncbi:RNA polymerase sigma factor [candidate division KSB1 bacterium]|nr:RNA polymerase sigma factor [candidate division KSB1 bacterium]
MSHDEKALIKKAQRGNILAFESLVKNYDRQVLQLAYNMVNNTQDAEDIYQEVLVRVYKNLHRFEFKSEFSTWLYRVVVNYCINFNKKRRRLKAYSIDREFQNGDENWKKSVKSEEQNPEESFLNLELSREIEAALQQLSPKQKTVFILRHYHGHKLKEIAEILKCSEGTVKNYLFRATQKMQRQLKEYSRI